MSASTEQQATVDKPDRPRDLTSPVRPVANDCAGGYVNFTFDDGPYVNTTLTLDRLRRLNLKAIFFVIGNRIPGRESVIQRMLDEGHFVQNHTYDHTDLVTGIDDDGRLKVPWGPAQIEAELTKANEAIMAAGAPRPIQYRPPFGSVNKTVDDIAEEHGLLLVRPWLDTDTGQLRAVIDSRDTEHGATPQSVSDVVTAGMGPGSIIVMHDGGHASTLASLDALQSIVDVMNAKHLCSTTDIVGDATSGALAP